LSSREQNLTQNKTQSADVIDSDTFISYRYVLLYTFDHFDH